jgi:hypothetical protein
MVVRWIRAKTWAGRRFSRDAKGLPNEPLLLGPIDDYIISGTGEPFNLFHRDGHAPPPHRNHRYLRLFAWKLAGGSAGVVESRSESLPSVSAANARFLISTSIKATAIAQ